SRHGLERGPDWCLLHAGHLFGRDTYYRGHPVGDRLASTTGRYQLVEMGHVILRQGRTAVINDEWRLVQCQLGDCGCQQACSLESKDRAGRVTKNERRSTSFGDYGLQIFDLALDRVGRGVAAVAS